MTESLKLTHTIEYEQVPTKAVTQRDWEAVAIRLDNGETPTFEMSEKDGRAFYIWALKHRKYRISTASVVPGIMKLSKKEQ